MRYQKGDLVYAGYWDMIGHTFAIVETVNLGDTVDYSSLDGDTAGRGFTKDITPAVATFGGPVGVDARL